MKSFCGTTGLRSSAPFCVFAGGLTDWATEQFSASLRRMQAIDDHIILNTDWHGTDWPAYGIEHTERRQTVTREASEAIRQRFFPTQAEPSWIGETS